MPPESPRRLNLVDGMILVAGLAGCFLLTRLYLDEYYPRFVEAMKYFESRLSNKRLLSADLYNGEAGKVITLWLALISPVLLLIRLRPPRPDSTRIWTQPGTSATGTATLMTGIGIVIWTVAAAIEGQGPGLFFYRLFFSRFLDHTGSAIAVCWLLFALTRRWAAEPGAIDRAGRFLGVCWIVLFLAITLSRFHQQFVVESLIGIETYFYTYVNRNIEVF